MLLPKWSPRVFEICTRKGCPWDKWTCADAAKGGHLECLKYSHEKGCPWDEWTCSEAAKGGHLECLKYAHEKGCPWSTSDCSGAARRGHLEILNYLHENGCPWDEMTCYVAAIGGHLECLKYAHEKGCPWEVMRLELLLSQTSTARVYRKMGVLGTRDYDLAFDAALDAHIEDENELLESGFV